MKNAFKELINRLTQLRHESELKNTSIGSSKTEKQQVIFPSREILEQCKYLSSYTGICQDYFLCLVAQW